MHYYPLPVCYFPTTVLLLDDRRDFLLNVVLHLEEGLAFRTFNSPVSALEHIKKRTEAAMHRPRVQGRHCIYEQIYNPRRFAEISVVMVDFAMPAMNGIEFCHHLNDTNIKKIVLAGKAEEKLVVEAFNAGLINRYIHKSDPDAIESIKAAIAELQRQHCQELSNHLINQLSLTLPANLQDNNFVEFFQNFCHEKNIVEYYLADDAGSFVLLDNDAKVSLLQLKKEVDKAGLASYYYAHVLEPELFNIDYNQLFSYHHYLDELDAEELSES